MKLVVDSAGCSEMRFIFFVVSSPGFEALRLKAKADSCCCVVLLLKLFLVV